jgi:hypothetical protein
MVIMSYQITSRFNDKESFRDHLHTGYDFAMEEGEPLRAIENGIIHLKNFGDANAGKTVLIELENGRTLIYGHLSKFANLKEGQRVSEGDLIGYAGHSGFTVGNSGNHLHFGVKEDGNFINPSSYIEKIQHMNDVIQQNIPTKTNFFDMFKDHMDLIGETANQMKVHLISIILSTDYTPFIKFFENVFQFIFFNF